MRFVHARRLIHVPGGVQAMVWRALLAAATCLLALECAQATRFGAAGHQSTEFAALGEPPEYMRKCRQPEVWGTDSLFSKSERLGM